MTTDRDRTTVRRALRVGAIGGVIVLLLGLLLTTAGGVPLRAVAAAAIAVGLFLAAGWLLLSMLLDTFAGEAPGRRRTWWTVGVTALAMLAPFFLLSAFVDTSGAA